MKDIFAYIGAAILFLVGGAAALCALAFNLAIATIPIWGGALILMAIFG
ncbi:hypothetical protein AB4589_17305 [Vibrio sp. 10N.222.49.A3]